MPANDTEAEAVKHRADPEVAAGPDVEQHGTAGVGTVVGKLASWIQRDTTPTGELARLRRMDPTDPVPVYPVLLRQLKQAGLHLSGHQSLRGWSLIAHCLALTRGRHHPGRRFGAALYAIGMTDLRINSLLRADLDQLTDLLPRVARRLGQQQENANWAQPAWLVLGLQSTGGMSDSAAKARSDIAKDFVIAQYTTESGDD